MAKIPAIFLTFDRDFDLTIFCLIAYAQHWPDCPLHFYVPVNSPRYRDKLLADKPSGLSVEPVLCEDSRIVPTLRTLLAHTGDSRWIFWSTSDRYPYTSDPECLLKVADALLDESVPDDIHAVRMTRWRDIAFLDGQHAKIGGVDFERGKISQYGMWHHHFVKRHVLDWFLADAAPAETLLEFHKRISGGARNALGNFLLPQTNLLKFEEPMLGSERTLNYALRQLRRDRDFDLSDVTGTTAGFSSPAITSRNSFWRQQGFDAQSVLLNETAPIDTHVNSFGGTGSKMIARWLQPGADIEVLKRCRSHQRLPPLSCEDGKVVYVFGDPRNSVVSIFQRREPRTRFRGFWGKADQKERANLHLRHARNLEVNPAPMTEDWDLTRYVKNGADIFRLEEHFDNWLFGNQDYPVLFVRYETLATTATAIAKYMRRELAPPSITKRRASWSTTKPPIREALDEIYGCFARRLESLPDAFVSMNGKLLTVDQACN